MLRKLLLLLFFLGGAALLALSLFSAEYNAVQALAGAGVMVIVFIVSLFVFTGNSALNEVLSANKELQKEKEMMTSKIIDLESKVETNDRINDLVAGIQGSNTLEIAATELLKKMAKDLEICQGVFYVQENRQDSSFYKAKGVYAYHKPIAEVDSPEIGVGLVGQAAKDKKMLVLNELPVGYIEVISGLGKSQPSFVAIIPLINKDEVVGVMELATLKTFSENEIRYFEQMQNTLGFAVYLLSEKIKLYGGNKLTA
jgi:hypothetical protein